MSGSEIETAADFLATPLRFMLAETEVEMKATPPGGRQEDAGGALE